VVSHTQSFDEYIDYDKNGNIDRLQRFADQNEYGNVIEIDALGYHYEQHPSYARCSEKISNEKLRKRLQTLRNLFIHF